jgi:diguanylate cyclase (GGDEF)-like protein
VLVSDLDGFKDVNDQYGHLRGNELLAEIAVALQNACREYDFVARLSGDEFVLILPGATGEVSERRANVLRGVIEKAAERLIPGCGVTASIGIAAFPADGVEAHELLAKADRAMYAQKAASPRIRPFLASGRIWPTATPLPKPLIN